MRLVSAGIPEFLEEQLESAPLIEGTDSMSAEVILYRTDDGKALVRL